MRPAVAACVFFLALNALPVHAAEEPEAVYAKWHRATVSGNFEEMARYASDAQRAEIAAMSQAQKDAGVKLAAATMPRAFLLRNKSVDPGGQGARLVVSGPGATLLGDKTEMLYGSIRMVMLRGEWKVSEVNWSNVQPAGMQSAPAAPRAAPSTAAPAKAAPAKAAAPARGVAPVGSLDSAPVRKLGTAKPPCVYQPVMTAEDLENCR